MANVERFVDFISALLSSPNTFLFYLLFSRRYRELFTRLFARTVKQESFGFYGKRRSFLSGDFLSFKGFKFTLFIILLFDSTYRCYYFNTGSREKPRPDLAVWKPTLFLLLSINEGTAILLSCWCYSSLLYASYIDIVFVSSFSRFILLFSKLRNYILYYEFN